MKSSFHGRAESFLLFLRVLSGFHFSVILHSLRLLLLLFQVVNKPDSHGGGLDWTKICEKSSKVITFIDLAGHEKYLKTTVFGMTGHLPDFCMLMVRRGGVRETFIVCVGNRVFAQCE